MNFPKAPTHQFYDVFISYGRPDSKEFAKKLQGRLTQLGFKVWLDLSDIPPAVDYQNQIDDGIDHANNFLFIISPHSVNSPYCAKEIERAIAQNKRIIPVMHVEQISRTIWQERHPTGTEADWQEYQAKGLHASEPNMHREIESLNWVFCPKEEEEKEEKEEAVLNQTLSKLQTIIERDREYVQRHTFLLCQALAWERHHKQTRYLLLGEDRIEAEGWLKRRFENEQTPCEPTPLHCEFICESIKNANNLMTQVFLSHAEEDWDLTERIRKALLRESITIWTSKTDIQTGEAFQEAINRGIEQADTLVYLISPAALESRYCQQEIEYALSLNKRIIPLLVKPTDLKQVSWLSALQWIDFTDNLGEADCRQDIDQLIKVLQEDAAYYEEHKILLTKALKWERQSRNPSILLRGYNLRSAESWLKTAKQRRQHLPTSLQETFINESLRQPSAGSLDTFISYSRADSDLARKLNDALQLQGKTTWFDQESIASGTDFKQEIYRGIEQSDNILFVLSPSSVNSPYCSDEVNYAVQLNKRFVTVLHRAIATENLHSELTKIQWIDFSQGDNFHDSFNHLIRTLDTDREHVHSHTKWSQRALEWQEQNRSADLLLRGSEFAIAEAWLKDAELDQKQPLPTDLQKIFIQTSRKAIQAEERKEKRRVVLLRSLLALMSTAFVGAVGIGIFAFKQKNLAEMALRDQAKTVAQQSLSLTGSESDREFDALIAAMRAGRLLRQQHLTPESETQNQLILSTQEALYRMKEHSRLEGHSKSVNNIAISPDGQMIATSSSDGTVKLWTQAGHLVQTLPLGDDAWGVSFSRDNQTIATWSRNHTLKLWTRAGELLQTLKFGDEVWGAKFSPDSQTLVTWSRDQQVQLWTRTGKLLKTFKFNKEISGVSLSPDGQRLAIRLKDGTVKFWNYQGKELLSWQESDLKEALFSPDGKLFATRNDQGVVKVWDLKGRSLLTLSPAQKLSALEFSRDGRTLATAGQDGLVRLWRVPDGQLLQSLKHNAEVKSVSFSADGQTLLTASQDRTARLWNLSNGAELETWQHENEVSEAVFIPQSELIVTLSGNKTVKVWNLSNPYRTLLRGHTDMVRRVIYSPDGKLIATSSSDNTVKLWHRDGKQVTTLTGHKDDIRAVNFSPNSQLIATAGNDQVVKLWSVQGTLLHTFRTPGIAKSINFSADSRAIAVGIPDKGDSTVQLFSIQGQRLKTLLHQWSPLYSPDGRVIATVDYKKVHLWTSSGTFLRTIESGLQDVVLDVSFSPDSQIIALASADSTVQLWSLNGERLQTLKGHRDSVLQVAFSPDGKTIATGSEDGTVKLWNLQGQELETLKGHAEKVFQVRFSPNGKMIATASNDQTIKFWNLQGNLLQTLRSRVEIFRISFSPDGQQLAVAGRHNLGTLWNLDLKNLSVNQTAYLNYLTGQACNRVGEYLTNKPQGESDRYLCDGISKPSTTMTARVAN